MTTQQYPAQFDWATELSDAQGHVTLSEQEAHEIGARLRRLHSVNETLQAGYAAARPEIESLQARIKTMAEEHADELMVAHFDGRMRAEQPAPQQEAVAWLNPWRADQVTTDYDAYGEHGIPLVYQQPAPATQQASQQEPVAWYVTGCGRLLDEDEAKAEARHIGGTARAVPLYTTPQPTQAQAGAVPLTDEQIEAATGAKIGTPLFLAAKGFVLATEAAHGIKGGQHGTE